MEVTAEVGGRARYWRCLGCGIYGTWVHSSNGRAEDCRKIRVVRGKEEGAGDRRLGCLRRQVPQSGEDRTHGPR